MNRIEYYLQYIQDGIPFFVDWVMNHPVQASFVWFFLSLSIIIILVFVQTRDIKDVYPEKAGNGYDTRIVIHNETGYHLSDYTIRVVRIDNIKCSYQLGSKQVTYTMGKASAQRSVPELRHGKTIVVKLHPLVKWIMDINKFEDSKKTIGEHSLEIIFHAFDKKNNVVDLYIFADVEIKENEQSKIVIVKEVAT